MQAIVDVEPKERLLAIPGSKLRFNIRIEHPKTSWKRIEVLINYSPIFSHQPSRFLITEKNEINMSSLTDEITVTEKRLGEVPIGDIIVNVDGQENSQYLPTVRMLSPDGYFEEKVAEKLRQMEFEAVRLGGPRRPDVEANPRKEPTQRIQVEATLEDYYDIAKYRIDVGKFHEFKRSRQYKRLLIVVNTDKVADGVIHQLRRTPDPISLVRFVDLEKLAIDFSQGLVSRFQVIACLLAHTGLVSLESLT
jgi:hypothetical protein